MRYPRTSSWASYPARNDPSSALMSSSHVYLPASLSPAYIHGRYALQIQRSPEDLKKPLKVGSHPPHTVFTCTSKIIVHSCGTLCCSVVSLSFFSDNHNPEPRLSGIFTNLSSRVYGLLADTINCQFVAALFFVVIPYHRKHRLTFGSYQEGSETMSHLLAASLCHHALHCSTSHARH